MQSVKGSNKDFNSLAKVVLSMYQYKTENLRIFTFNDLEKLLCQTRGA